MRTKNSIKNILINFLSNLLNYGLRFASRIVFIKVLAEEYLGINGVLSNVLGLLALTELGIGSAIGFSLYKPLSENDVKKIQALMKFYKKTYRVIFFVVLILGLGLLPFLSFFIKDTSSIDNLNIIYLIFLGNMAIGYLFSYKRTLIDADQKNYKIATIVMIFSILTTSFQIVVLLVFKNYIIYLLVQSLFIVLEHLFVNRYINKQYPFLLKIDPSLKIDSVELSTIKTNVKALMLHKIGSYVVTSTDNLVISKYLGLVTAALYSNYLLIINMISAFIQVITGNVIAGFGNLIASEKPKRIYKVYKEMDFICYILYGVTSVCLINLFTPFIDYSFGSKFVLPNSVLYIIVINYYFNGLTIIPTMISSASGLYKKDQFAPLIQSLVNLVVSVFLAKRIGLAGVFIGTFICMIIPFIIKPYIIYKYVFEERVITYFINFIKETIIVILASFISMKIVSLYVISSFILDFIITGIISVLVTVILIFICYKNTDEFHNLKIRMLKIIKKDGI